MAVNVNTVYKKVLALANKEQRGYITPQDFNLFADHAQQEIFEQYFYDLNQASRVPGSSNEYSDTVSNLNEKIAIFEKTGSSLTLPADLYRLGTVICDGYEVEQVQQDELLLMNQSKLTAPTTKRKVYVRTGDKSIVITPTVISNTFNYVASPSKPNWGYIIVGDKALYNNSNSTNFELHKAEESELVYRILALSGIAIQKPELTQTAAALEGAKVQQEKQ